jgi:hypothetical protein
VRAVDEIITGMAVHTGARVMAQAGLGEILVSSTVKDLVAGSGLAFRDPASTPSRAAPASGACWPSPERARNGRAAANGFPPPADPVGDGLAAPRAPPEDVAYVRPRYFPWADLLRRVFEFDILACPDCGGRLHLVATIEQAGVIEKILTHLGLPAQLPSPAPARSPAWLPGWSD